MSKKKGSRTEVGKKQAARAIRSESNSSDAGLPDNQSDILLTDLRTIIESARQRAAVEVNSALVMLYWHMGERIQREILEGKRAEYGKQIIYTVSRQLTEEYGRGFTRKSLMHMIRFAEVFPDIEIVSALRRQLSWTHFRAIIYLKDSRQREFYSEMCRIERWSTRTLNNKIQSMLYERTAISRKPKKLAERELAALRKEDLMTPDLIFRDPYILDFVGLTGAFSEKDLEQAIIVELQKFILELGSDFSFIARQKRMTIGLDDFYLDLLFFHRHLNRLVAIELKLGKFTAAFKGQMELYLRWLDKYERQSHEKAPIGLIFCSENNHEQVELLQLCEGEIRVAEYLTGLPPRRILKQKLEAARRRVERMNIEQLDEHAKHGSREKFERAMGKVKDAKPESRDEL